jgi:hypothetical protein
MCEILAAAAQYRGQRRQGGERLPVMDERDCPDRQQFHLTVTRERQWIWLDAPANIVTP